MRIIASIALIIIFLPLTLVGADGYKPLVGIPGVTDPNSDFNSYIKALYVASISIAALLAVIKIVIAGVKWMLTDVVTSKGEAKKDIQAALIGLLVVLSAVLVLTVINPKITNVDISLSQVSKKAYNPATDGPSAPKVVIDAGVYSFINKGDNSPEQIKTFITACKAANNFTRINDVTGRISCFVTGAGNAVKVDPYCIISDFCNIETETVRMQAAVNKCADLGGTYTDDPIQPDNHAVRGICIYPKP